jgi:hypothetical protein
MILMRSSRNVLRSLATYRPRSGHFLLLLQLPRIANLIEHITTTRSLTFSYPTPSFLGSYDSITMLFLLCLCLASQVMVFIIDILNIKRISFLGVISILLYIYLDSLTWGRRYQKTREKGREKDSLKSFIHWIKAISVLPASSFPSLPANVSLHLYELCDLTTCVL